MIRSCLINYTPTYALARFYVHNNTSLINNDMLKQRLSFLPIHIPKKYIGNEDKLVFKIDKKNDTKVNMDITTDDLIIMFTNGKQVEFIEPKRIFRCIQKVKPNSNCDSVPNKQRHGKPVCSIRSKTY